VGGKPCDTIVIFKSIILCAFSNLSDEQLEYRLKMRGTS